MIDTAAAATASAKSWTRLAEGLEAQAAPFIELANTEGMEFLADLLYITPMLAADRAYTQARIATARA